MIFLQVRFKYNLEELICQHVKMLLVDNGFMVTRQGRYRDLAGGYAKPVMDLRLILSFLGGLTFTIALAAGVVRPWRGLVLIWAAGVLGGASGLVPGLTPPYVAAATVLGAAALAAVEGAARRWLQARREAVLAGEQMLLGMITVLLAGGILLGTTMGLALTGAIAGLGMARLVRRHFLPDLAVVLMLPGLRLAVLMLPAVLLGGRLLGLF